MRYCTAHASTFAFSIRPYFAKSYRAPTRHENSPNTNPLQVAYVAVGLNSLRMLARVDSRPRSRSFAMLVGSTCPSSRWRRRARQHAGETETGMASWYGAEQGHHTASGERFDPGRSPPRTGTCPSAR